MIPITEHIQKLKLVQLFETVRRFEKESQEPFGVRINYDKLNKAHPQFLPDYDFSSVDDTDGLYRFIEYQDQYYSWYTEDNYHHLGDELFCLHPFTAKDFEPGKPWLDYPILYDRIEYSRYGNNLAITNRFYREDQVIHCENHTVLIDFGNNHWYRSEHQFTILEADLLLERHNGRNGNNRIIVHQLINNQLVETKLDTLEKLGAYVRAGGNFSEDPEMDLILDLDDLEAAQYLIEEVNPLLLEYFSKRLRDDENLIELATAFCDDAIAFASDRIKDDPVFIEHLISTLPALNVPKLYESLRPELKAQTAIAVRALAKDFDGTWKCLTPEMKEKEEIKKMLNLIPQEGSPICHLRWVDVRNYSPDFQEHVLHALREQAEEVGLYDAFSYITHHMDTSGVVYYFGHQELTEEDRANLPQFYTNIQCVSFDHGGILALEHSCSQAYRVCTFLGDPLFDDLMHDVAFHLDGSVTVRPNDVDKGWYTRYRLQLPLVQETDRAGFDNDLYDLPSVGPRDQLVCIDGGRVVENVFNPLSCQNSLAYRHDSEKAIEVVHTWPWAFSQLSPESKSNPLIQQSLLNGLIARRESLSPWIRVYSTIRLQDHFDRSQLIDLVQKKQLEPDTFPYALEFDVLEAFAASGAYLNAKIEHLFMNCSEDQWIKLVGLNGRFINLLPERFKTEGMYKIAANTYLDSLSDAPKALRTNIEFARSIVSKHPNAILYFEDIATDHEELNAAWIAFQKWLKTDDDLPF